MTSEHPLPAGVWDTLAAFDVPPSAVVVKAVQPSIFRALMAFLTGNRLIAVREDEVLLFRAGPNFASVAKLLAQVDRSSVQLIVDYGGKRGVVQVPGVFRVTIWGEDPVARFESAISAG